MARRPDLPNSAEREEICKLRAEVFELPRANEILKPVSVFLRAAPGRSSEVSRYIDEHRGRFGVEPICRVLDVSASAYHHHQRAAGARSRRAIDDERLLEHIREVHRPTPTPTAIARCGRHSAAPATRRS